MHRSISFPSKLGAVKAAQNPCGIVFDEATHLPLAWEKWEDLAAWVVWQNSDDIHKSFVFSHRLVVPDHVSLVRFLLECCSLPFKWVAFQDDCDPMVIRSSVLDFIKIWIDLGFQDFQPKTLALLLEGLKGMVNTNTLNQYKLLGLRRANFVPLVVTAGDPVETFPAEFTLPPLEEFSEVEAHSLQSPPSVY